VLLPHVVQTAPSERNSLLSLFTRPECCSAIENRADQRAALVAQLRAAYGHHVGDPAWTGFIRRMEAVSPEFAAMWATQDVAHPHYYAKGVPASAPPAARDDLHQLRGPHGARHPDGPSTPPDNEATRAAMERLVARPGRAPFSLLARPTRPGPGNFLRSRNVPVS